MPAADPPLVTGLILAGGRGSRMGGADKGWVDYRGKPLVEHTIERLRPQVDELLISANRSLDRYRSLGTTTVQDDATFGEFAGPLAGMHAVLRVLHTPWLVVVPCDAPHLPADLVQRLRTGAGPARAAVASAAGRLQPLFCLLHRDLFDSLTTFLAEGERKVERWLARVQASAVRFEDAAAFVNFNTPSDLQPGAP